MIGTCFSVTKPGSRRSVFITSRLCTGKDKAESLAVLTRMNGGYGLCNSNKQISAEMGTCGYCFIFILLLFSVMKGALLL